MQRVAISRCGPKSLLSAGHHLWRNIMIRARRCAFILVALLAVVAAPASAQSWPTRTVKFILTLGPGSGADIGARLLADRLTKKWNQPIVIENRPGGDGTAPIKLFLR